MKLKTTASDATKIERLITSKSIDDILGLTFADGYISNTLGPNRRASHCHSFSAIPINKLSFDLLFYIIANYDVERGKGKGKGKGKAKPKHYLQPDHNESDIKFLLDELSAAAILILSKSKVQTSKNLPGLASSDLAKLSSAIKKSKYLPSHEGMKELMDLAFDMWENNFMLTAQAQFDGGGFSNSIL